MLCLDLFSGTHPPRRHPKQSSLPTRDGVDCVAAEIGSGRFVGLIGVYFYERFFSAKRRSTANSAATKSTLSKTEAKASLVNLCVLEIRTVVTPWRDAE
jgi:hypothetical protein